MQNYYEILEVDKNASDEIIEKAYKLLAKKYHPDIQAEDKKQWAEEKLKLINEAYDILSDTEKRAEYNKKFKVKDDQIYERYDKLLEQNKILKNQLNHLKAKFDTSISKNSIEINKSGNNTSNTPNSRNKHNEYSEKSLFE